MIEKIAHKIFKFFGSLKLAVIIILALGVISAVGTVYESRYDADTAQKLVFHSPYMYITLFMLIVNLTFSAAERWPWKSKHTAFLLAHLGIIVMIVGSYVTRVAGIDGSMAFGIGEGNRMVSVKESEVTIYQTPNGELYDKLFVGEIDFLTMNLKDKPHKISVNEGEFIFKDFYPFALRETKYVESTEKFSGPALRFQLQNSNVSVSEWVIDQGKGTGGTYSLGPAQIIITTVPYEPSGKNEIVIRRLESPNQFEYTVYSQNKETKTLKGTMSAGDSLALPWMGFTLRALKYIPYAKIITDFKPSEKPNDATTPAVLVEFKGKENWIGLNTIGKFFTDTFGYVVAYGNKRLDIGFDITLNKFNVGRYPGTGMAMSYESEVSIPDENEPVVISMNNPMKRKGFTFYQASFQEDEMGRPNLSILSVNRDPGRWIKYLGSIILVSGIIHLFHIRNQYFKPRV